MQNFTKVVVNVDNKIKVMLSTEGTYPFHHGGVSTWCDSLVKNLHNELDFVLYSIMMNPFVTQKFDLPKNVQLIKVPLWGTEEPSEHLNIPFSKVYISKKRTTDNIIKTEFLPLFNDLISEVVSNEKNPQKFGETLYALYQYFQEYEYKKSFKSEHTWNLYKNYIIKAADNDVNKMGQHGPYSMVQSLGWIYRFMTVLNTPVPKVNVTHSAAAAFCGIPCVISKFQDNTHFILTEHGVYLREQYLSLSTRGYTNFLNTFLIRFIHSVVNLNYFYADQVSPVCNYNTRWEERLGVLSEKIHVIYNGVDNNTLTSKANSTSNKYPTIVSIARIDPVKDITSLLEAAYIVKEEIPEVRFIVYGSITVPSYYEECLELKDKLNLGESFIFAGHTNDVTSAYNSGDIVVLSSISEGFPYSVVEAMMVGKPIISTDVGGVKEALADSGVLIPPREPKVMANEIIKLIKNPRLRTAMAEKTRVRALNYFTMKRARELYLKSYIKAALTSVKITDNENASLNVVVDNKKKNQDLLMQRGYALLEYGLYKDAISELRKAIFEDSSSPAVPIILMKIADAYNFLGEYDKAFNELEKAEMLMKISKLKL
jgi:polysaccharide biosynthesis protein PelF